MKFFQIISAGVALFTASIANSQEAEAPKTNLPPDPFANLELDPEVPDYTIEVDRTRGTFSISAEDGNYVAGSHFANWHWKTKVQRWGNYFVGLKYQSVSAKMGVNVKIGESVVKSYAPRTSSEKATDGKIILGDAYIPKPGEYPVTLLTGDASNGPDFTVKGIEFIPAPEAEVPGQSIDGTIQLEAKTATTYSEMMRYEPKPEKNCLGYWIHPEDWAEWKFDINNPGKFKVFVVQGCGKDQGGSDVAVLINDKTLNFTVEDTGGFQTWKTIEIGEVELDIKGTQKLAIKPLNKAAKAVMDIQKVMLEPIEGE